jgi:hypothetical protein
MRWARVCLALAALILSAPHLVASQSPPSPGTNSFLWLDFWSFSNTNNWADDFGDTPISFTNLSVGAGQGSALVVDISRAAWLRYNVWPTNATNLTVSQGSVSLWFAPHWAGTNQGGTGPQVSGRLVEAGTYTTNASVGWWSLFLDPSGCFIYFSAQNGSGHQTNYITAPLSWSSNAWHNVVATYSSSNTALYLDGAFITNGPGMSIYPSSTILSNGFTFGSDAATGLDQAHGAFDDISTYSSPLSAETVSIDFTLYSIFFGYAGGEGHIAPPPSQPDTLPVFDAVTGSGYLTLPHTNFSGCVTSNSVWITNATATVSDGAVNLTFTIEGGSNGVPYDVFATTAIEDPITNAWWTWMGQGYQCVIYTIETLTNSDVFLLLGTPLDSYGNGLTDAYERLVLHKNPAVPSGDGMLDGWKVLWGMNPAIDNSAQPGQRANYTYDGTGRLETLSGFFTENNLFDSEGNLTTDQQ